MSYPKILPHPNCSLTPLGIIISGIDCDDNKLIFDNCDNQQKQLSKLLVF